MTTSDQAYPPPAPQDIAPAPQYVPPPPIVIPPPPAPPPRKPLKIVGQVVALIAVLIGVVVGRAAIRDWLNPDDSGSTVAAPTNPFDGTPAANFARGEEGILVPTATAVAGFSQQQVAEALDSVKEALIEARLNQLMVVQHDTKNFLSLFGPEASKRLQKYFTDGEFISFATQIAAGYSLTADPVRVKGEMKFGAVTEDDIRFIEVTTNYVWVYPFTGELTAPGDHLVTVHDTTTWRFPADADVEPAYRGMWIDTTKSSTSNMDCALADKSLLALGAPEWVARGSGGSDQSRFMDPNGSLNVGTTC